ncbi:MAG: chemotaxis-specific protein-glutamate methyltransferase CheB [Alphaproteobacteria bacterium]|nr:chemotaxis-specific protein-glutamate methyltransferase CheB [Alphaproteobacteria bacterium]
MPPALPLDHFPSSRRIRLLIVDDSAVARSVFERIVTKDERFEVCEKLSNAADALAYLSGHQVDIIMLDIEMPGQSGLAALPAILKLCGHARVIILSSNCDEGSASAVEALAMGASDIMSKPGRSAFGGRFSDLLIERLLKLGAQASWQHAGQEFPSVALRKPAARSNVACLGVGASTGGIHALGQLFDGLGAGLGIPILLTQHLPPSFMPYFAMQLARMTTMPVKVAENGDVLLPDRVYIAPGEAHLTCKRWRDGRVTVVLDPEREPFASMPGVDPMFSSMADIYGANAVAIVLTGMGRDGTAGAERIAAAGGLIVAQNAETSVVWGMPGSIARAGLASAILSPDRMGAYVMSQIALAA